MRNIHFVNCCRAYNSLDPYLCWNIGRVASPPGRTVIGKDMESKLISRFSSLFLSLCFLTSVSAPAVQAEDMSWPSEDGPSKPTAPVRSDAEPVQRTPSQNSSSSQGLQSESAAEDSLSPARSTKRVVTTGAKSKPITLYGRIDQIASEASVQMPSLQVEKPSLDLSRRTPLKASTSESRFSGSVESSFPMDFSGTWGGTIRVWRYSVSPLSYEEDANESNKLREILTPGTAGDVNFTFQHAMGKIDLEPAQVRIMIPASQSFSYQKMMQGGAGGMGGMVSQMMANMKVPVILHFGTVSTNGSMEVGVSGNQIDQRVVKNEIRQLASDVVEEQIVTRNSSVQSSGRSEQGYTESVLRFTRQSASQMYVLAASVDYDASGKFLRKLIMYGNVNRGQVMNTSPVPTGMGNMTQMLQQAGLGGGAGGMEGLSSILNSLGAATGGASNYSQTMQQYANNPAVRQYLNGSGGGNSHMEGFGQMMNSLNMLSR